MSFFGPTYNPSTLSPAGAAFIAAHEGFVGTVYQDDAGNDTVGYGHLLPPRGSPLPAGMSPPLTQEQGRELLALDAQWAAAAVSEQITVALNQNQFDALVSFAFGAGSGGLAASGLVALINAGKFAQAAAIWPTTYVHNSAGAVDPGLVLVRPNEARLFATPAGQTYVYNGRIAPEAPVVASGGGGGLWLALAAAAAGAGWWWRDELAQVVLRPAMAWLKRGA